MTAPPAEGVRVDWESVPVQVRAGIEQICGSPVLRARSQPGGFSPIVRALVALGPMPIRELASAISVTHSAASQTVAEMNKRGFVTLMPGQDARQRVVHLTERTMKALPVIQAEWEATRSAAEQLDAELPFPLTKLVPAIARALERKPFRQRIAESAQSHPNPALVAAAAKQA